VTLAVLLDERRNDVSAPTVSGPPVEEATLPKRFETCVHLTTAEKQHAQANPRCRRPVTVCELTQRMRGLADLAAAHQRPASVRQQIGRGRRLGTPRSAPASAC
jgi:hypothetical protein